MNVNNFTNFISLNNDNRPEPFFYNDSYLIMINCISNNNVPQLNYNYINLNNFQFINNIDFVEITLQVYNNIINIEKNITINNNLPGNKIFEIIENNLKIDQQYDFVKQIILNYQQKIENDDIIVTLNNNDIILVEIYNDILDINLNSNLVNNFLDPEFNLLNTDNSFDNLNNLISFLELLNENNENENETKTLTSTEFNNLYKTKYCLVKDKIRYNTCQICLDDQDFQDDDDIIFLPCNHIFHYTCLQRWLLNYNNTCPVCRYNLSS